MPLWLDIGLVIAGMVMMLAAILRAWTLRTTARAAGYGTHFNVLLVLAVLFLIGYGASVYPLARHDHGLLASVLSSTFLGGAFFVLVVVELNARMTRSLRRQSETLEEQVAARTEELRRANRELAENLERLQEAQRALVQSEKMALMGKLSEGVAHEINNPIGYIRSNLQTLRGYMKDLFAGEDPAAMRQDVTDIINESLGGVEQIAELAADFSQLAESGTSAAPEETTPARLVSEFMTTADHARLQPRQIDVQQGEDVPVRVVRQNVVKAISLVLAYLRDPSQTTASGEQAPPITLGFERQEKQVCLYIRDPLLRVSEQEVLRMFDPDVRHDKGKSDTMRFKTELSLAYQLLHHGGARVEIETGEEGDCIFKLLLPVA